MKNVLSSVLVLAAWAVTLFLANNLFAGNFDSSMSCQTDCRQTLYWSAIGLALPGTLLAIINVMQSRDSLLAKANLVLGFGLISILFGIMVIAALG
ncbi:hypothetical protein N8Y82_02810 [Gammaproteobacteria bacterium]|jgi:hypothetical protein|nr:hypothetical protein [Pseudomonadota bacterium]MDC1284881.1 hypothetical protein [Gammaproteobacteria bacterium]